MGYQMITIQFVMNLTTGVAVRKIRIHKKIIPAKVRAHPPSERCLWKKRGGKEGKNGV